MTVNCRIKKKFISSAQRIFTAHLSWFHKCQLKNKEAHFKELSEDGGLADFSKKPSAPLSY
jgi:hypothetical protein